MNTENNKLIAEFLCTTQKTKDLDDCYILNGKAYHIEDLNFHSNWNWLMEVVEKIFKDFYNLNPCPIGLKMEIEKQLIKVNKEAVYNACVEFIKWYNQQPK